MGKHVTTIVEARTPQTADTRKITLLDRIGGPAIVHLIVDRLIDAVTNDPDLRKPLAGIDIDQLHLAQMRFFIEAFGGSASSHRDATLARVDGESLVRIVIHLHDVLDSVGLPQPLAEQLMLAVAAKVLADGRPASAN